MQFKEIIGQEKVKRKLTETVNDNRVSHTQLFLGPEGCGKLALAIAYAQYINCKNRQENDSCGVCPSCIKYNKLIHPDLHFVFPVAPIKKVPKPISKNFIADWREILLEKNYYINANEWFEHIGLENKQGIINKDDCNEIIKTLSFKTYESEYKIMIIWMVEKLFHAAAPKLLKILEEPPDKTLFILIAENQHQILNTILSRAQIVKIPKILDDDLLKTLSGKTKYPENNVKKAIRCADGNWKEAIKYLDQSEEEEYNFVTFREWMRICFKIDTQLNELNAFVDDISTIGREKQKSFFGYALRTIRSCLAFNYGTTELEKFEGEELKFIKGFSPFVNSTNVVQLSEEFNKAFNHIERNAHPKLLFTDISFIISKLLRSASA